jgi:hypothetical protein
MPVLLITYDHSNMNSMVDPIQNFIKEYKHVQLSKNSYAIETNEKTKTIYHKIKPYLIDTPLFVVTLTQPFMGHGLDHASEWLRKHLPED